MTGTADAANIWKTRFRNGALAALRLAVAGLVLGWFYAWAAPWAYPEEGEVGFKHGVLHGALMPMALPSLVLGKDVPIFADNNTGKNYKIGYICGINLCGLIFFGGAFARPRKRPTADPVES